MAATTFTEDGSVVIITQVDATPVAFPCKIKALLWTGAAAPNVLTITNDHSDTIITLKWVSEVIYLPSLDIILGGGFKCTVIGGGTCLVYIGGPN